MSEGPPYPADVLHPGERWAEPEDWAEVYDEDAPVGTAYAPPSTFEGIGASYFIHVRRDGAYQVTRLASGREALRTVLMRQRVTWREAMNSVRDAIQSDLDAQTTRWKGPDT